MPTHLHRQLTFDVAPHPATVAEDGVAYLVGTLKLTGELHVVEDLQDGQELTVQVADADGQVIAAAKATVQPPAFKPIRVDGRRIGTERAHKAELGPS